LWLPIAVGGLLFSELVNRRRVSQALKRASDLTERRLLEEMSVLDSGVNVADYLRRLRTEHDYALASIGARFLIGLMRSTELVTDHCDSVYSLRYALDHKVISPEMQVKLTGGESYRIDALTFMKWGTLTLDELGRLFEQIRER
jgi:hypothetical protein